MGLRTAADATFTYSGAQFLGLARPGNTPSDLQHFKGWMQPTFSALGMVVNLPEPTVRPSSLIWKNFTPADWMGSFHFPSPSSFW